MQVHAAEPIYTTGMTELIGVNEQVDQNDYAGSVFVPISGSGELLSYLLVSGESGSGAVQTPEGKLLIFSADPTISAGDTSITAAEAATLIGVVDVASGDYVDVTNAKAAYITDTKVPFHKGSGGGLWFSFKLTSATSLNDAAGDDEFLNFSVWYRKE